MRGQKRVLTGVVSVFITIGLVLLSSLPAAAADDITRRITARLSSDEPFAQISTTAPALTKPDWYYKVTVTYSIGSNGNVSSLSEFATLANQTLNDSRGWARLGVKFVQVDSGGSFRLILAEASKLPTYSSGCSVDWSCRVGNQVIINDTRWTQASPAWTANGGSLRDYRHMVVNHETGHWLGHDHVSCGGTGQYAPVMQQQSIDLMGCKFNPWPLDSELWTSRF